MIKRSAIERLVQLAKTFRSVAVAGPRQSVVLPLCRAVFPEKTYVSLENPDTLEFASSDPRGFSAQYYFSALEAGDVEKRLVYGGKQSQTRSNGIRVNPWSKLFD